MLEKCICCWGGLVILFPVEFCLLGDQETLISPTLPSLNFSKTEHIYGHLNGLTDGNSSSSHKDLRFLSLDHNRANETGKCCKSNCFNTQLFEEEKNSKKKEERTWSEKQVSLRQPWSNGIWKSFSLLTATYLGEKKHPLDWFSCVFTLWFPMQ